jgi:phage portal protein, HK97 family|nr:MAG TPA: portal protein [Caudoviricetes sp.]DAS25330.1 MAG TPA: portal protein [Caudoviricetes sp.]DAX54297.1 MAG TPA: portal protein [Caudoviricetes sp.]
MEFRNLIDTIFNVKPTQEDSTKYTNAQLINSYTNFITNYNAEIYNDLSVRSCVDTIARHVAKLKPVHIIQDENGRNAQKSSINSLLANRPNIYMSTSDFLYKVASQLLYYGNAFVYIQKDNKQNINGFYPIDFTSCELKEYDNNLYLKFNFNNAKNIVIPYTDIIHIRRNYSTHDLLGQDAYKPLLETLTNLSKSRQSISNKVENGGKISGILKLSGMVSQSEWKTKAELFADWFKSSTSKSGGVATIDSTADFIPVSTKAESAEEAQLKYLQSEVYSYFGINEAIVNGSYNETEWQAFYESIIEGIKIQLSQEFTAKVFTEKEKEYGNIIDFNSNRLTYASTTNKVNMVKELGALGLLTTNEARELFDLPPVEDGDKRLVSLNYINADKADEYQLKEKDNK